MLRAPARRSPWFAWRAVIPAEPGWPASSTRPPACFCPPRRPMAAEGDRGVPGRCFPARSRPGVRCLTLCRLRRGGAGGAAGRKRIGGRPGWEAWRDRPRALPVLVLRKAAGGRPLDAPLSTSMPRSLHPSSPSPALPFPLSRPRNHLRSSPWSPPRIPSFAAWSLVALLLSTGASCGFSLFPFVLFFFFFFLWSSSRTIPHSLDAVAHRLQRVPVSEEDGCARLTPSLLAGIFTVHRLCAPVEA